MKSVPRGRRSNYCCLALWDTSQLLSLPFAELFHDVEHFRPIGRVPFRHFESKGSVYPCLLAYTYRHGITAATLLACASVKRNFIICWTFHRWMSHSFVRLRSGAELSDLASPKYVLNSVHSWPHSVHHRNHFVRITAAPFLILVLGRRPLSKCVA